MLAIRESIRQREVFAMTRRRARRVSECTDCEVYGPDVRYYAALEEKNENYEFVFRKDESY